jgi:hypothetical protein
MTVTYVLITVVAITVAITAVTHVRTTVATHRLGRLAPSLSGNVMWAVAIATRPGHHQPLPKFPRSLTTRVSGSNQRNATGKTWMKTTPAFRIQDP